MASFRAVAVASILLSGANIALAQCSSSFTLCQPSGATATGIPSTGPELAPLYNDLLDSVQGIHFKARSEDITGAFAVRHEMDERDSPSICCNDGTNCVNLQNFNVPMCYDKFTTNFRLANGASGTIDSGAYSGIDGSSANLKNGTYSAADKSTGNMYTGSGASQSPTDFAAIPSAFTGTGVGSAIPISALGIVQTLVVTIPEITVQATTFPGTTDLGTIETGVTVTMQTAPSTIPGTTKAGTTIAGTTEAESTLAATTIPAHTSLITTTVPGAPVSSGGAFSTSSQADAVRRGVDGAVGAGLAGVLVAAMAL